MITADPATDTTVLVVSMTIIITIVVMGMTAATIAITARLVRRARPTPPPEYWRMLARVCDARPDTPPAAAIDD